MCGIFASVNINQIGFEKDAIKSINHRGLDSNGCMKDGKFMIGMTRLSIIDIDNGSQPISNEDESAVKLFPDPKEKIWNQSHSDKNFIKYNKIIANLFYFIFIEKKQINHIEEIFR